MLIFALVSTIFAFVSRKSLLRPHSHGFARFFAWEAILGLCLLNHPHWVESPLSANQIISWLFLLTSIYLVAHGVYLLRTFGRHDGNRSEDELLEFEKTSCLVTVGVYRYIRHPLYSSLLFLAWGAFLKHTSLQSLVLMLAASYFVYLTAARDESECLKYFGDAYRKYRLGTKWFIPFVF